MGNFNRGDRSGGGRNFRRGGNSDRPQMHSTTCSDCGKRCEVPFKPTGDKPVYCSDCFGKTERGGSGRQAMSGNGGANKNQKQFEMLDKKLDDILDILSAHISGEKKVKKAKPVTKVAEEKVKVKKAPAKKKAVVKKAVKKVVVKKTVVKKKVAVKKPAKKAVAKKTVKKKIVAKKK